MEKPYRKIIKPVLPCEDGSDEVYLQFTDEELEYVGWKVGDVLNFKPYEDGFIITKKDENNP
jgi:hypothetical protein